MSSHNTFASGGSDGFISIWDHTAKKRMKLYPKYPTAISALAFSPDGTKLAIGASYEHDNAVVEGERGRTLLLIKDTVMEDCKVSRRWRTPARLLCAYITAQGQSLDVHMHAIPYMRLQCHYEFPAPCMPDDLRFENSLPWCTHLHSDYQLLPTYLCLREA